jgi:hypothetical protein
LQKYIARFDIPVQDFIILRRIEENTLQYLCEYFPNSVLFNPSVFLPKAADQNRREQQQMLNELNIMQAVEHPNVCK